MSVANVYNINEAKQIVQGKRSEPSAWGAVDGLMVLIRKATAADEVGGQAYRKSERSERDVGGFLCS